MAFKISAVISPRIQQVNNIENNSECFLYQFFCQRFQKISYSLKKNTGKHRQSPLCVVTQFICSSLHYFVTNEFVTIWFPVPIPVPVQYVVQLGGVKKDYQLSCVKLSNRLVKYTWCIRLLALWIVLSTKVLRVDKVWMYYNMSHPIE